MDVQKWFFLQGGIKGTETRDQIPETGHKEQETRDKRQVTRDRRQEMGDKRQVTRDERQETGHNSVLARVFRKKLAGYNCGKGDQLETSTVEQNYEDNFKILRKAYYSKIED